MNAPKVTNRQLLDIIQTYWAWRTLWLSTTVCFTLLGLAYVLFLKADVWVASQGLIVRDEANGAVMRLGRFQS
jgi:polysaccharide biosynthesis transport protein